MGEVSDERVYWQMRGLLAWCVQIGRRRAHLRQEQIIKSINDIDRNQQILMSLLRPEDFIHSSTVVNPYWNELLSSVDQFDQLMELEKRQIEACIKQFNLKRIQLLRQFCQFKDSLRYEGEVPKQDIYFIEGNQLGSFFQGFKNTVIQIIEKVVLEPKVMAELLGKYADTRRLRFDDFLQNVVFNIYPYYLPSSKKALMTEFIGQLFRNWTYNVELVRPVQNNLVDQAIGGLLKAPSIVCYVQKIISFFLQESNKCHMSIFAFDEEAIANEIQIKKNHNATFSHQEEKPQGWRDKFKSLFKKEKSSTTQQLIQSRISTASDSYQQSIIGFEKDEKMNLFEIMRFRQKKFFELFHRITEFILSQQVPIFLCRLLACFDGYLDEVCPGEQNRLKHYCYFLMTNLILAELHNKFTSKNILIQVSHQESGMTPADLQNISEVIKFLNGLFQGVLIESEKYRFKIEEEFEQYRQRINKFYATILARGKMRTTDEGELLQNLLVHYEQSVVLSLNDLVLISTMLKSSSLSSAVEIKQFDEYIKNKNMEEVFQSVFQNKSIKHKSLNRSGEHIFLVYEARNPSMREIRDFYLTVDEPITDIPFIRQVLIAESNMEVQQSLEIQNDLKLIQKLPIKELRGYLGKIALKHKNLRVRDGRLLQNKFQDSFKSTLTRSLHRKEWLLYYRNELSRLLGKESDLMAYFTGELNSAQFYVKLALAFCNNVKFKIYLNIEDNLFRFHENTLELKKIQISTMMVAKDDSKSSSSNENYILRNSFKIFENYKEIMRCMAKNNITIKALNNGRKIDDYNQVFQKVAETIVGQVGDFIHKRQIMQVLSQEKLALIVVRQMQDYILLKFRSDNLINQHDNQLFDSCQKINKAYFWKKDLEEYGLDRQFIVAQGVEKFRIMTNQSNVWLRLKHFGELFKIIFTILGFTMAKNKISAEIVNPLVQYIILECPDLKHHDCLFSIQALKWRETPEDSYHLTLYQSALTYIRRLMPNDYPL